MANDIDIIKGLHGIQHDVLRVITVSKTVHELIPRYDPVIREKVRLLKTLISDKAVLILLDYMEHVLDMGTKSGFCDMANLLESMINLYLEADKPVDCTDAEPEIKSHVHNSKGKKPVYRIMNKRHKIKRYKAGCVYDIIMQYILDKLPVDFMKVDVKTLLSEYYEKAKLKIPKDSSLDTYAGLYLRCGREIDPPVFRRMGFVDMVLGRGKKKAIYRKTGDKLQVQKTDFDTVQTAQRWTDYENKIIKDNYRKMSYRNMQRRFLQHRTVKAIEKHANATLKLRKPYAEIIEEPPDEPFTTRVVDKLSERQIEEPDPPEAKEKVKPRETVFHCKDKKPAPEKDIVDYQGLPLPDQIYTIAEKSGWARFPRDISLLVVRKHFPDKTIDEIKSAIKFLIAENKVTQMGADRIRFKGYKC